MFSARWRSVRAARLVAFVLAATACDTPADVCESPPAGAAETWLGLSAGQLESLVELEGEIAGERARCSGVVVAPRLLLTAQHCSTLLDDASSTATTTSGVALSVGGTSSHPGLDLLAVSLEEDAPGIPLPASTKTLDAGDVGRLVELTGFSRATPRPWFQVEAIAQLNDDEIVTDTGGVRGACRGDSGAPLLWRGTTGAVEVIGVLSDGSQGCTGEDRYVRLDVTEPSWWPALDVVDAPGCGALPTTGRCYGERAVWCEDDAPVAASCEVCGWDEERGGYRCLPAATADPCGGVPELGRCEEGDAVRCVDGLPEAVDCARCGASGCHIDRATNRAVCGSG